MSNTIDTSVITTEVPAFNVSFFLRKETVDATSGAIISKQVLKEGDFNDGKFKTFMDKALVVSSFQNDLFLGNFSSDTVSRTQQIRPEDKGTERVLARILDYGNSTTKYTSGNYNENIGSDGNAVEPTTKDHIGLHTAHYMTDGSVPGTGIISFLNANVAYENSNGFNVNIEHNLLGLVNSLTTVLDNNQRINAYLVITAKNDNDVLGKVQTDVTDIVQASDVAAGDINAQTNSRIISYESVTVSYKDDFGVLFSDFELSKPGDPTKKIIRPVSFNIMCDIYRSSGTTLVGNVIVLNRLNRIEEIQDVIIKAVDDPTITLNIDSHENINNNFIVLSRIATIADSKMLYDKFHSSDTLKNAKTVTKYDGKYTLSLSELNGANAYNLNTTDETVADLHTVYPVSATKCGHSGLYVEQQSIASGLLARTLKGGETSLDNIFWELTLDDAGQYTDVPATVGGGDSGLLSMFSYRKGLSVVIFDSLSTEKNKFVSDIVNAEVPSSWRKSTEQYDGFPMLQVISKFGVDLKGMVPGTHDVNGVQTPHDIKFPILYYHDETDKNYSFVSMNYYAGESSTKFDKISEDFVHNWIPKEDLDEILNSCGIEMSSATVSTADLDKWIEQAKYFVGEAVAKGFDPSGYLAELDDKLIYATNVTVEPLQKFSALLLEALYVLSNGTNINSPEIKLFVRPTKTIGSGLFVFKNSIDQQSVAVNLNVDRIPQNLLMETTSLALKEVAITNISNLRDKILASVGNAMQLLIPIVMELSTGTVEVTGEKKYELTTDFLVECLSKLSLSQIMNQIWYYKDTTGKRIVIPRSDTTAATNKYYNNKYEEHESAYTDTDLLANLIYTKVWRGVDTSTSAKSMLDIMNDSQCRMRLAGVKADPTARGALKDYRYPGAAPDVFAENTPNTSGGFALQVLQWIASGLVNIPSSYSTLFNNKDNIFRAIRNNAYESDSDGNITTQIVSVLTKLDDALKDPELQPLQHILDHIQANDGGRFAINEKEADDARVKDPPVNIQKKTSLENAYMLPLIEADLLSFVSTVNGKMEDPTEAIKDSYTKAIEAMVTKLNKPNELNTDPDPDGISHYTMALTGHAITQDAYGNDAQGTQGLYYTASNLFIDPAIGPFEKKTEQDKITAAEEVLADATSPQLDIDAALEDMADATAKLNIYQVFKERSWEIRLGMHDEKNMDSYETIRNTQLISSKPTDKEFGLLDTDYTTYNQSNVGSKTLTFVYTQTSTGSGITLSGTDNNNDKTVKTSFEYAGGVEQGVVFKVDADGLITSDASDVQDFYTVLTNAAYQAGENSISFTHTYETSQDAQMDQVITHTFNQKVTSK